MRRVLQLGSYQMMPGARDPSAVRITCAIEKIVISITDHGPLVGRGVHLGPPDHKDNGPLTAF